MSPQVTANRRLMPFTPIAAAIFGALGATLPLVPASAQQAPPAAGAAPETSLEAIVVTAQKREENAKDVPITMTVFTGATIEQAGFTDLTDYAKFVPGLDVLMPPLAGALNGATVSFLLFDAVGAFLWSAGYCFVGYLFADHLDIVAATLGRMSRILAILIAGVLCYLLWRAWELLRTMRELRLRTISPAALEEKLQAGKKVAVLDLLDVEGRENTTTIPGIAGAARVSPTPLRNSAKVRVPSDVQIVLYCSSLTKKCPAAPSPF